MSRKLDNASWEEYINKVESFQSISLACGLAKARDLNIAVDRYLA